MRKPAAPATEPHHAAYSHLVRVYWEDTDAGGVVFYANYLKYFERARTEWLRSLGVAQQALLEQTGALFVVADTQVRYLSPARLDDELRVTAALGLCGAASMTLHQQAWRGGTLLAQGQIRVACVDAQGFRPRRLPHQVSAALAAAGAPDGSAPPPAQPKPSTA